MAREPLTPHLRRTLDKAFHGVSGLGYPILQNLGPFRRVRRTRDLTYAPELGRHGRLDLYRPKGAEGKLPTVFYVHGGAFSICSKETHRIMAYVLATRGYQVVMPNYRLGPEHPFPTPFLDVSRALAWCFEEGQAHGVDPSRVAIMGDSAGANLASALAIATHQPRPEPFARELFERSLPIRCVLPRYGILDVVDVERFYRRPDRARKMASWVQRELRWVAASYVGHPRHVRARAAELASPLRVLEAPEPEGARALPPFFIAVGTKDPLLPDSRRLADALRLKGVEVRYEVYPGELHAFDVMIHRRNARAKWAACFEFLESNLVERPVAHPASDALEAQSY
jgi:acetyl esterase